MNIRCLPSYHIGLAIRRSTERLTWNAIVKLLSCLEFRELDLTVETNTIAGSSGE